MKSSQRVICLLTGLPLWAKLFLLVSGALLFFFLFPFFLKHWTYNYMAFLFLLLLYGVLFRIVAGKKIFRITVWLWASGSFIYMIVAFVLIVKGIQPLPYIKMDRAQLILYYASYPMRVLGIFFTGLIFSHVTSPAEFLRWGRVGLKIALAYRAFEYSLGAFEQNRFALLVQGKWPDFSERKGHFRKFFMVLKSSPLLIATTFRNIIFWFPWAWICYNRLQKEILYRRR